jgi:hypothetical protein
MDEIHLLGEPLDWLGAMELVASPTGLSPRRLPAWTRPQIPDLFMDSVVALPSGVRLRFATDATAIELDVMVTHMRLVPEDLVPSSFDLVVEDAVVDKVTTTVGTVLNIDQAAGNAVTIDAGDPTTIRFDDLSAGAKTVEIWLPQRSAVEVRALRVNDGASVTAAGASGRRHWVHYGSSISHCIEASSPTATWPAVAARIAGVDLHSFGFAGQCMLDPYVARTIRDMDLDVVSIKVGINVVNGDTMRERTFGPAVNGFLDTARDGHPDAPILVVSPIFCPAAEDHPGPTVMNRAGKFVAIEGLDEARATCLTLTKIRRMLSAIVASRRDQGDKNLHYLDGLSLFGPDDAADLPDDLHPNAAGYVRMGERFAALALAPGQPLGE